MRSVPTWNRSVLLVLVSVAAYSQTWVELWPFWEQKDATYTHGSLIAVVTAWLIWRTRGTLADVRANADLRVVPLVLLMSVAWLLAARANVFMVHVVLWPALTFTILWAGVGWRAASTFAFPLAFLYFAIPVWDYLKPALQTLSAAMVGFFTGLAGVPALIEGPTVVLPNETIYIALECSGAHFLSVALAVAALAGEIRRDNLRTRFLLMVVAALLSMVFNWLRILLIVFAYLNPELKHVLETMGHYTFGWWVFAFDLLVFYLVLRRIPLSEPQDPPPRSPENDGIRTEVPIAYPLAIAAALLLPAASLATHRMHEYAATLPSAPSLSGTDGPISPNSLWQPDFVGAAWEHRVAYIVGANQIIELYRNEYHEQTQGSELISVGSPLFDAASFTILDSRRKSLATEGSGVEANRTELVDKAGRKWLALHTYVLNEDVIASARLVQFRTAVRSLFGRAPAGVLAVMTLCKASCEEVDASLERMLMKSHDAYMKQLDSGRTT